jgi:hypothetical protein
MSAMIDSKEGSFNSIESDPIVPMQEPVELAVSKEEPTDLVVPTEESSQHLSGLKLVTTMSSLCIVGFLLLLDVSVISTVSYHPR